jgi:hypothetical protein
MKRRDASHPENPIVDILTASDEQPDWLIPNLILQGTMNILAGDAGAGKSYVSYTLGLAIAAGVAALDGLVPAGEPRKVLYFDEENSRQDRDKYLRRSWIGLAHQGEEPDLALLMENFWPVHFALGSDDWEDQAAEWIRIVEPAVCIYDTATPCFNIADENDNGVATAVMKQIRALQGMTNPVGTSIVLKHAKVVTERGGSRTIRGAKSWKSGCDQLMFQIKAQGRPRKDGLSLTRLEPDKRRAYGLTRTIYITPQWTDKERTGLVLHGAYEPDGEHKRREDLEEDDTQKKAA